jgi:hypothetical protein
MNLKDIKVQVMFTEDSIPRVVNAELTFKGMTDLEKIQDDFTVGFAKFLRTKCIVTSDHLFWFYNGEKYHSENELLEIYKKETNEQ